MINRRNLPLTSIPGMPLKDIRADHEHGKSNTGKSNWLTIVCMLAVMKYGACDSLAMLQDHT